MFVIFNERIRITLGKMITRQEMKNFENHYKSQCPTFKIMVIKRVSIDIAVNRKNILISQQSAFGISQEPMHLSRALAKVSLNDFLP